MFLSDFSAIKNAVLEFSAQHEKKLKTFPLFDLSCPDYGTTPWPGGTEYSIVYVVYDAWGSCMHIGTTERPDKGLNNYFGLNPDGTCRPKGGWPRRPAYLQVVGVGWLTGDKESPSDYILRYKLRTFLNNVLYTADSNLWFPSLREMFLTVTPQKLVTHLPWLKDSRQLQLLERLRQTLTREKLVTALNTDRYCLVADAMIYDMPSIPAVDYRMTVVDKLGEYTQTINRTVKDFSWLMNLRVYRTDDKIHDWQMLLYLMRIWFDIELNPDEEE